jgi:hypothetical protein
MAVLVVAAPAMVQIQILAAYIGQVDFTCVFVFQFVQAAFRTAITQSFPFFRGELL